MLPSRSVPTLVGLMVLAAGLGAISKVMRMMLQSAVLGIGAYLVIYQMATAGIVIAGSILAARALAPVDLAIADWKGFVAAGRAGPAQQLLARCRRRRPAAGPAKSPTIEAAAWRRAPAVVAQDVT
jgi:ABC-type protease/lipase transport system fused ATPase/permease subunit